MQADLGEEKKTPVLLVWGKARWEGDTAPPWLPQLHVVLPQAIHQGTSSLSSNRIWKLS